MLHERHIIIMIENITKRVELKNATLPFSIGTKALPYSGAAIIESIDIGIHTYAKILHIRNTSSRIWYVIMEKIKRATMGTKVSATGSKVSLQEVEISPHKPISVAKSARTKRIVPKRPKAKMLDLLDITYR